MSTSDDEIAAQVHTVASKVTGAFAGIGDPTDRARAAGAMLEAVPDLQRSLREIRQNAVRELRAQGLSHAEVGEAIGVHRNRAAQIAGGRTGGTKRSKEDQTT